MAQLNTTHTFIPGETVTDVSMNNIIDQAVGLDGLITDPSHPAVNATTGDKVLVSRGGILNKADVNTFPLGATSVGLTANPATVFNVAGSPVTGAGTLALSMASQNQGLFMASPVGSAGVPAFRAISPADTAATVVVAANLINWSLGNVFSKSITGPGATGLNFSNPSEGQEITVLIGQTATPGLVNFPTGTSGVYWTGGTVYVATALVGRHDVLIFRYINGHYYGNYLLNFLSV